MIWHQKIKPFVPKYANYDYARVYDGNDQFIGWIRIYYEYRRANNELDDADKLIYEIDADKLIYEDVDCTDVNTYMVAHVPMIEARPTAYDIDKVVKQLEEIKAYMLMRI